MVLAKINLYCVLKVIFNLDSTKASVPDGIPVAVLKKCEPELSSYWLNSSIRV